MPILQRLPDFVVREVQREMHEFLLKNMASVDIYYQDLNYEELKMSKRYDVCYLNKQNKYHHKTLF